MEELVSLALKKVLFDEYLGFADKRVKKLENGKRFIIDDRSAADEGAKGLYSWFCMMFATVSDDEQIEVMLTGNVPTNAAVKAWFAKHGKLTDGWGSFNTSPGNTGPMVELARLMRTITAPGAKYSEKSYKYVVPRTAGSLERLAAILESYASSKRG